MLYLCTQDSLKIGEARAAKRTGKKKKKICSRSSFPPNSSCNVTGIFRMTQNVGWRYRRSSVTVHISGLLAIDNFLFECSPDALIPDISFFFLPSLLVQIQNTLPFLPLFIHASHSPRLHFSACLSPLARFIFFFFFFSKCIQCVSLRWLTTHIARPRAMGLAKSGRFLSS